MCKTRLLFSFIFLSISYNVTAQDVKPEFKKFVYATYRASGIGNKKVIRPEVIMEVNSEGVMHRFFNFYFDNSANLSFNGGLAGDTTYQVPDSLISKLNEVFDNKPNLVQQTEFRKLHQKQNYYGPYIFISFTDNNGVTHNLILADLFDTNIEFRGILIKFLRDRSHMNRDHAPVVRDQPLEATILKCHNNCKNLPQLKFENFEVADPGVKH
jgi:hypothetical protein